MVEVGTVWRLFRSIIRFGSDRRVFCSCAWRLLVAQANAQYGFVKVTAKLKFEAERIQCKMIKFPREAEPPRRKRYKVLDPAGQTRAILLFVQSRCPY